MGLYVAGDLARMPEVAFETLCLYDAVLRVGIGKAGVRVERVAKGERSLALLPERTTEGEDAVFLVLEQEKDPGTGELLRLEFRCLIGDPGCSLEAFAGTWERHFSTFRAATREEVRARALGSRAHRSMPGLVAALRRREFEVTDWLGIDEGAGLAFT